jgi:hypothetical protein
MLAAITALIEMSGDLWLLILGIGAASLLLCFLIIGQILKTRRIKSGQRRLRDALIRYHQQQEPVDDELT